MTRSILHLLSTSSISNGEGWGWERGTFLACASTCQLPRTIRRSSSGKASMTLRARCAGVHNWRDVSRNLVHQRSTPQTSMAMCD
eukprot:7878191-Pyramimonas_sp.AAC.1